MKITNVEAFVLGSNPCEENPYGWRPIGCRIHTDEGIFGDGEAAICYGYGAPAAYGMIRDLAKKLIGLDPLNIDAIWDMMYNTTFWGQNGGPIIFAGISAIDIALWDIKGKFYNAPLYMLLGGKHRDKLRAYASQLQLGWPEQGTKFYQLCPKPEDYARNVKLAVAEGYDAVKIDFFQTELDGKQMDYRKQKGLLPLKLLEVIDQRMAAAREAAGPYVDIIVENHSLPDANGAVQIAKIAEKYNIFYFEEPNTPSPKTLRYIERNVNVPISNGERLYTRWQYAPYFEDGTVQIIQPDIGNSGGITETRKICDMAHIYDVSVQAHVCASPLSTDVATHLETAIPNFCIHEHHVCHRMAFNQGFTKYNRQPVNGFIEAPDLPGIGNEFLQEAIDRALEYDNIK